MRAQAVTKTSISTKRVVGLDEFDSSQMRERVTPYRDQAGRETDVSIGRAAPVVVDAVLKPVTSFGKRLWGGCVAGDVRCGLDGRV